MVRAIVLLVLIVLIAGVAAGYWYVKQHGFSARAQPTRFEAFLAEHAVELSYPASAKSMKNPLSPTPEIMDAALTHYAHDCAVCHGNDGKGKTEIGEGLYPPPPDLTAEDDMTDGELYYIIRNGVRFTGMPGWQFRSDDRYWRLVLFIRHLPQLTTQERAKLNEIDRLDREAH